jgi:hypothetical protein
VLIEDTSNGIPKIRTTIADNVPIDNNLISKGKYGGYSWAIPSTQAPGIRYKIAVQSKSQPAINDGSDNYFRITSPDTITVTSPNGGNTWYKGTTPSITWTSNVNAGSYVKIELLKAGSPHLTISASTPNDGSFSSWPIPNSVPTGTDYRIRITSTTNPSITDTSNADFTITSPTSITVTVPNGGQTWKRGTSQIITWDYAGNPGTDVMIVRLNKTGAIVGTITDKTLIGSAGHGSFLWHINPSGTTGTDCKIKIQSLSQPAVYDTSDNYFTLLPASTPGGLVAGTFMMD